MNQDDLILLIDAGNTRVKWGWLAGRGLRDTASAAHAVFHAGSAPWSPLSIVKPPSRVLVANVAGAQFAEDLRQRLHEHWHISPEFIKAQPAAFAVINGYSDPAQLGADRWATLVAAHSLHLGATCIVDCGSAITLDVLRADGQHLGGVILPGLQMMRDSIAHNTHARTGTSAALRLDITPFARDTAHAIFSGTACAVVAAINRIVADIAAQMSVDAFIITGGDALQLMPHLTTTCQHVPQLVLDGLAVIARSTP